MKKLLPLLLLVSAPAYADMNHSISSSVKFESLSAATLGGFGSVTSGVPSISFPSATQATSGEAFSFAQSYVEGDATPGSAVTVGTVPNFSDLTSTSAGSVGTAAVAIDNHTITMTPGTGTGIVITGQFVVDLTIE